MNKTDSAIHYFRDGYNCSQSVLMACAGKSEETVRAAAAFGGGMGRMQKTCGVVTGAYIWFGMKYGAPGLPDEEDRLRVYNRVREFNRIFIVRNGTDQCSELLGHDLNNPDEKRRIDELGLTERVCEKCIRDAMDIIELLE